MNLEQFVSNCVKRVCCSQDNTASNTVKIKKASKPRSKPRSKPKHKTESNQKIIEQIKHDINSCIQNDGADDIKIDIEKVINLITTNEETEQFSYDYIKKLATNEFNIDGDDTKSSDEVSPKLAFDNTTLEKRLPNFDDLVYTPSNIFELIDKMQDAVNKGISIKAMGSRYAYSEITFTDGLLIDMFNSLNDPNMEIHVNSLNKYGKQIYDERNLHLAQSGASIETILNTIWPENDRQSLIDKQTKLKYKTLRDVAGSDLCIGGIINTGSAAEGIPFRNKKEEYNYGSTVNQILAYSMIIIDDEKKVRLVQIEADINNGAIHDAIEWENKFPNVELIQNDDIFEAGLVSMGLLGVIYSYYILLEDAYFIEEHSKLITYDEFKNTEWNNISNKILNHEIENVELLISPYKSLKRSPALLVQTYSRTDKIPSKTDESLLDSASPSLIKSVAVINNWLTRTIPEIIPFTMEMTMKMMNKSCSDDNCIKPCTEIGAIGSAAAVPSHVNGFAFNYDKNIFFNFLDDYIKLMNELRRNDRNQVSVLPLSIRFSSYKSKGFLSMFNNDNGNNKNGYFWFECIMPNFEKQYDAKVTATIENRDEILHKIQILSMSKPYFGNPHWGLYISFKDKNENIFRNIDPNKLNKFINIYKKYNKTKSFSNKFTKQSGLDHMTQL